MLQYSKKRSEQFFPDYIGQASACFPADQGKILFSGLLSNPPKKSRHFQELYVVHPFLSQTNIRFSHLRQIFWVEFQRFYRIPPPALPLKRFSKLPLFHF